MGVPPPADEAFDVPPLAPEAATKSGKTEDAPVDLDEEDEKAIKDFKPKAVASNSLPAKEEKKPVAIDHRSAGPWTEITTFALDLGSYDKPLITVDMRLKGIEALPS